jgi:hypothetical protein
MPRLLQKVQCAQDGQVAETVIPPDRNPPFVLWEGPLPDGQQGRIVVVPGGTGCTVVWFVGERIEAVADRPNVSLVWLGGHDYDRLLSAPASLLRFITGFTCHGSVNSASSAENVPKARAENMSFLNG